MFRSDLYEENRIASLTKTVERLASMPNATLEEKLQDENVKCIEGIIYVPFDEVLMESGYFLACAAGNFILTDSNFDELSDNAKYFMLLHETGHQVNKHLERIAEMDNAEVLENRLNYLEQGKVDPMELEADAYALNFMTKEQVYEAMNEMQEIMDDNFVEDHGELALRREFILA